MKSLSHHQSSVARGVSLLAGWGTALLGLVVILGWHLKIASVIQIHPSFAPMQYNTALGFLLAGVSLLAARRQHWPLALGSSLGVTLIGVLTLLTLLFPVDLGLDQLFMQHYITVATSMPGRMAPNTALCFALCGAALLWVGLVRRLPLRWHVSCLLAALAVGLSLAALVGYAVAIPTAYGWGNLTRMALHTAVGFVALGSGLLALSWQAKTTDHRWQPWAIGVVVSTTSVTLWQGLAVTTGNAGSAGNAPEFVLAFGILMALALARAVAYSQELRGAANAMELTLTQLHQEMAERKKAEEQVRQLAFYDMLTRLPNRLLLRERLQQHQAASKRSGRFGAVMFLDLDNFKPLNDTHGHAVGDLLLVEAAQRLLHCVRETDTVARFGGDEFVVMLSKLDERRDRSEVEALQVADKIQSALSAPYLLAASGPEGVATQVEHRCSASIGICLFYAHEAEQSDILKWADAAMYQAKESGRNAVRLYQPAFPAPSLPPDGR